MKEFDLDEKFCFPDKLIFRKNGELNLVFSPEYPNWIVLDDIELELFFFLRLHSIKESMILLRDEKLVDEKVVIEKTMMTLEKINNAKFYKKTIIKEEEHVSKINKTIHINLTNDCNLRCKHCYMSAGFYEKKEIDISKVISFLDNFHSATGETEVVLSGGEPLVYNNVFEVAQKCKEAGNRVVLFTNGLLINENNINEIIENIDEVQISMEGISKESYETIRGYNTYKDLLRSLDLLSKHDIEITFAITVLTSLIDDILDSLIGFLDSYSFKKVNVRINDKIEMKGNMLFNSNLISNNIKSDSRIIDLIRELKKKGYVYTPGKEKNIHFSNCGIGTTLHINFDGKIYPCSEFGNFFYNIDEPVTSIIEGFNKINLETSLHHMLVCKDCDIRYICSGGCRIKNYNTTGSYTITNCDQFFINSKYDELFYDYLIGGVNEY